MGQCITPILLTAWGHLVFSVDCGALGLSSGDSAQGSSLSLLRVNCLGLQCLDA